MKADGRLGGHRQGQGGLPGEKLVIPLVCAQNCPNSPKQSFRLFSDSYELYLWEG